MVIIGDKTVTWCDNYSVALYCGEDQWYDNRANNIDVEKIIW